jgi:leucine-rich PPR motif-containing protein
MESRGIEPNRVTFQYFVARYCHIGDMAGATAILEHMKKNDMAINEAVFHSLILGHCKSGDLESATSILGIMTNSGLTVGAETYTVYLTGMIRSGQPREAIKAKLEEVKAKDVQLHDHDYLQLMLELVRAKKNEEAREIIPMLPKKSGFFQEVRNVIPQLIFENDPDLAFELYSSLNFFGLGSDGHKDSKARDSGLFILRAMVKNDYEVSFTNFLLNQNQFNQPFSR